MGQSEFSAGNVAVITGAAVAIGKATAVRYAELGVSVCHADLDKSELDIATNAASQGTVAVIAFPADVSNVEEMQALASHVTAKLGIPQFLINNAVTRINREKPLDIEQWRHAMDVNFWVSCMRCAHFADR